jgi:hypothetical protein
MKIHIPHFFPIFPKRNGESGETLGYNLRSQNPLHDNGLFTNGEYGEHFLTFQGGSIMKSKETSNDELSNILRLLQKNQLEIERLNREGKSPSWDEPFTALTSNPSGKSHFSHIEFNIFEE